MNDDIINQMIWIPEIRKKRNISLYDILREMGLLKMEKEIIEKEIYLELLKEPFCVDLWLGWSEDKRCSSSWFFRRDSEGKYEVGYYSNDERIELIKFNDKFKACAFFIKKEIFELICTATNSPRRANL
jgi:hypothetical protein